MSGISAVFMFGERNSLLILEVFIHYHTSWRYKLNSPCIIYMSEIIFLWFNDVLNDNLPFASIC